MSDYRYETDNGGIDIRESVNQANVFVWVHEDRKEAAIIFPKADAPTVAAELLKAAGRDDLAALIESSAREAAEKAEAEAAEKKLQERRDAIAAELNLGWEGYDACSPGCLRKAINRIIELEDGASRD